MILSRGTPVAKITSVKSTALRKKATKDLLLARLKAQAVTGSRNWTRNELYDVMRVALDTNILAYAEGIGDAVR